MIDVPVEVKDALREGRLKKNYRVVVLWQYTDVYEIYSSHESFTASITATYLLYNKTMAHAFRYVEIMPASGGDSYSINCPNDPNKTWLEFPLNAGDSIYVANDIDDYVILAVRDESSTTEDFTIDNNNLVSESISIDERMCSGDKIKFGLCEGSSMEFQYFGFPSIQGKRLQVFCDVDYGAVNPYTIPMGFFDVKKCSRQASTGIIKVTAYNKLMSEYLDTKANELIELTFGNRNVYVSDILRSLLSGFQIDELEYAEVPRGWTSYTTAEVRGSTFTPFKYTDIRSDQGPFSPWILGLCTRPVSTSSNIYIGGVARLNVYPINRADRDKPIRVDVNPIVNEVDTNIKQFILNSFGQIRTTVSVEELWNRLLNMSGWPEAVPPKYVAGYFFSVCVALQDGTIKIYGNSVKNGAGTFDDLNNTTFFNVMWVSVVAPKVLDFCTYYDSETGDISESCHVYGASNLVYLYGEDRSYVYARADDGYEFGTYSTPKMPDGSNIDPDFLVDCFSVKLITGGYSDIDFVELNPTTVGDVTLREIQSADFETKCQFGQLDRETDLFSGVELNNSRLYPQETLYPDVALYPHGAQASATKSMYSKLWADEGNVHKWRYLIITYKGLNGDGNETDYTLQRTVNADGTDDYNCSDNWLFRNLIWTAEQIGEYADAMVSKMQDMTWFPFEMWCAGLPYLETGDEIEIPLGEETYTSYILQRQLKGIQNLQDTYINGTLDIF